MALSVTSAIWQQVNSPALDIRRFISGLVSGEGVVGSGDMAVAQRAAGANMSVDIAAGQALVQGDAITNQGMYYAYNDGVVNLTGFTASHATLPRIDRVCLRVRDAFHGDAANDLAFVIVTGTATSGATLSNLTGAAAVPASHLLLANVLIPAGATTITTANIDTTVRPLAAPIGVDFAYTEFTASVNVTALTESTANTIVTAPAVTLDGTTPIWVEFSAPYIRRGTTVINLYLFDGSASIGRIAHHDPAGGYSPLSAQRRLTPTSGFHTYSIRAAVDAGTGLVAAGVGGVVNDMPGFIRITRA